MYQNKSSFHFHCRALFWTHRLCTIFRVVNEISSNIKGKYPPVGQYDTLVTKRHSDAWTKMGHVRDFFFSCCRHYAALLPSRIAFFLNRNGQSLHSGAYLTNTGKVRAGIFPVSSTVVPLRFVTHFRPRKVWPKYGSIQALCEEVKITFQHYSRGFTSANLC